LSGDKKEHGHTMQVADAPSNFIPAKVERRVCQQAADLQERDFGLAGYMAVSAGFFPSLYDRFEKACDATLAEGEPTPAPDPQTNSAEEAPR
jgi:hypothetical protein